MIRITGKVYNLERSQTGMNGFHVHELGDLSNGCQSLGPHFNPTGQDHGGPTDATRHIGDLGNLAIDQSGTATIDLYDSQLAMEGPNSILGRSVVVSVKACVEIDLFNMNDILVFFRSMPWKMIWAQVVVTRVGGQEIQEEE